MSTTKVQSLEALHEALQQGLARIHLTLAPGRHPIQKSLRLRGAHITLQGAGRGQTWLEGNAGPALLQFQGQALHLRDLSLLQTRGNADLIHLVSGDAWLARCDLRGPGMVGTAPSGTLAAVRLGGSQRASLEDCSLYECRYAVLAQGESRVELRDTLLQGHRTGVALRDRARLEATQARFEDNHYGVSAEDQGHLELRGCDLQRHQGASLSCRGQVEGLVEGCHFQQGGTGAHLSQHTRVRLRKNSFQGFQEAAISCSLQAEPHLEGNSLHHNTLGIWVRNSAAPCMEDNHLADQSQAHLRFQNNARGVVRRCHMERAPLGVEVQNLGAPLLCQNKLEGLPLGMDLQQQARPVIEDNHFQACQVALRLGELAQPTLKLNHFVDNGQRLQGTQRGATPQDAHSLPAPPPALAPRHVANPQILLASDFMKYGMGLTSALTLVLSALWCWLEGWSWLLLAPPLALVALAAVVLKHELALLRDGLLVEGQITQLESHKVTLVYRGPWGREYKSQEALRGARAMSHLLGQSVPVLINPQHPADRIVPAFQRISFGAAPAPGRRPALLPAPRLPAQEPEPWGARLWPALPPRLRRDPLALLPLGEPMVGTLESDEQQLRCRWGPVPPRELPWGRPFTAHLSFSPMDDRLAAVSLHLRPQGAQAQEPGLRVKSLLPWGCIQADVPQQEQSGPWLEAPDFWRLWRTVLFYAQLHGQSRQLRRQLCDVSGA